MRYRIPADSRINFSKWLPWSERDEHTGMEYPGVYVIARSGRALGGAPFLWCREIIYVGMTNAAAGLRGRLRQFDNTIAGKRTEHGGADRVRYKFRSYEKLRRELYVALVVFECDPTSVGPRDLRTMGRVAQCEYQCLAAFSQRFSKLPQFNDKKKSPKYSLASRGRTARRVGHA